MDIVVELELDFPFSLDGEVAVDDSEPDLPEDSEDDNCQYFS